MFIANCAYKVKKYCCDFVRVSNKKDGQLCALFQDLPFYLLLIESNLGCLERLVDVGNNVLHLLDAYGEADEIGGDPCRNLLLRRQLLVGRGSGMNDQRLGVTDVGQVRQELHAIDKFLACLHTTPDAETDDRPSPLGKILFRTTMVLMAGKTRIVDQLTRGDFSSHSATIWAFSTCRGIRT